LRTSSEEDASEAAQQDISSQLVEVETRELNKIENALDRMQLGKYGKCELCDGHIALPRLQALPYATFCFSCQTEKEKND
jgi:DnaK suppressor protein